MCLQVQSLGLLMRVAELLGLLNCEIVVVQGLLKITQSRVRLTSDVVS